MRRFSPAPVVYAATGLAAAALAAAALWQLQPTASPGSAGPLPLAGDLRLPAKVVRQADLETLRRHAGRRLQLSPADAGAWTILAYVSERETGRCAAACAAALDHAYEVAPLDPVSFAWRTRFALENWPALTPQLRLKAVAHMRQAWSTPEGRLALRDMARTVNDPAGRLAARLIATSLKAQPLARRTS